MARSKKIGNFMAAILAGLLLILSVPPVAFAEETSAVVTEDVVLIYYDADFTNYAGKLPKGAIVVVNRTDDSVAQITYQSRTGYCDLSALTAIADIARPAYINASGVKVYAKPNTSSLCVKVDRGTEVNVVAVSGNWALIEKNGIGAFMYAGYLTYIEDATPAPEATAQPTPTPVIEEIEAVVTSETLSVYKSASTSSTKLGTLRYGASVTVMAYNNTWAYIEKDGNYGYCAISGLTRADAIATPAPTDAPTPAPTQTANPADYIPAVVSADSVVVYESASTSSKKLGTLKKGAEINVVKYSGSWAYIEKNGNFGYCKLSALAKVEKPAGDPYRAKYPDVQFTATVVYDGAPVYADPASGAASSTLAVGTGVDVYAYNNAWAYVGVGDARGFVEIKYMSAAKYAALSSGDSSSEVAKLQAALEALGYFDGTPGGNFSTLTAQAVKRFQAAVNLTQTGAADVATLRVLYGGYAPACAMLVSGVAPGEKGANAERLQTRLYYLGYLGYTSSIDGDYGATTASAVKLFQAQAELTQDGAASPATLKAMYRNGAPKLPSSKKPADDTGTSGPSSPSSPNGVTKMPAALASTTSSLSGGAGAAEKIEYVIYIAQNQLGKPYIYGTAGPDTFDCSGFTTYCYRKVNVSLGRSAYAQGYQSASGTKIESMGDLRRGDIVCFNTISDSDLVDHVGIYLGSGYFIHCSSGTGNGKQVCISSLSSGYYNRVFSWGRRALQ